MEITRGSCYFPPQTISAPQPGRLLFLIEIYLVYATIERQNQGCGLVVSAFKVGSEARGTSLRSLIQNYAGVV